MNRSARLIAILTVCLAAMLSTFGMTGYADVRISSGAGMGQWLIPGVTATSTRKTTLSPTVSTEPLAMRTSWFLTPRSAAPRRNTHRPSVRLLRYQVRSGDTLWALAITYSTSVRAIQHENQLNSDLILVGQTLRIPGSMHELAAPLHRADKIRAQRAGVPTRLLPVYQAAGHRYGVPWTVLAAIHREETNFSTRCPISQSGAVGPMQFMPGTFAQYGVTAPGRRGPPDIGNVYDAIYSAAHMLQADGYDRNPTMALYLYNHSMAYVRTVQSVAGGM